MKVLYCELDYDADPTVYYIDHEDNSGWVKVTASKIICALPATMKISKTPSSTILEYVSSKLEATILPSRNRDDGLRRPFSTTARDRRGRTRSDVDPAGALNDMGHQDEAMSDDERIFVEGHMDVDGSEDE